MRSSVFVSGVKTQIASLPRCAPSVSNTSAPPTIRICPSGSAAWWEPNRSTPSGNGGRNGEQRVPDPGFRPVALILDLAGPNQQAAGVQQDGVDSDDADVIADDARIAGGGFRG